MDSWEQEKDESRATFDKRIEKQVRMADIMRRERIRPDDLDFKEKVSPYMAGEIDPSIAVHHDLDIPEDAMLSLGGYANASAPMKKSGNYKGDKFEISIKPGTVGAVHNKNTPYIYGHEYRHHNYPEISEADNRIIDLIAAQTDMDVDTSLRYFADSKRTRQEQLDQTPPSDYLKNASEELKNLSKERDAENTEWWKEKRGKINPLRKLLTEVSGEEYKNLKNKVINPSKTKQFLNDAEELEEYNSGLKDRNRKRKNKKPETMADSLRAAYAALGMEEFE